VSETSPFGWKIHM